MKTIRCRYVRQTMCLLMHFCYSKIYFHQLGPFKLIKNNYMFCKVCLQYGIVIQRVYRIHGLPCVQLSRMMNLKIEFAKKKCLSTIWSTEMIPIAWTYPARKQYKISYFLWLYNLTPTWFMTNFFNPISTPDCKRRITQQYLTNLCTDMN